MLDEPRNTVLACPPVAENVDTFQDTRDPAIDPTW